MMNSRMRFTIVAVLLAAFMALLAAPAAMAGVGDPVYSLARTGRASASSAASEPLPVPDASVAAVPVMTSSRVVRSYTVTGLYTQPNKSSAVISWIMPDAPVRILGLSSDLAFFAMATSENSPAVAGWIAARDLAYKPPMELAIRVAMVFRQPDTSSDRINYLAPGQAVDLLGVSLDGKWAAVRTGVTATPGWVQSVHLRRDYAAAEVVISTKTRLRANESSPVVDRLAPGQKVTLIARTPDGAWLVLESQDDSRYLGWARAGDVQHNMNLAALPVVSMP